MFTLGSNLCCQCMMVLGLRYPAIAIILFSSRLYCVQYLHWTMFNNTSCLVQTLPTDRSQIRRRRPWNENWFMWKKLEPLFFLCWIIIGVQRFGDFCIIVYHKSELFFKFQQLALKNLCGQKLSKQPHSLVSSYLGYHNKTHVYKDNRMCNGVVRT